MNCSKVLLQVKGVAEAETYTLLSLNDACLSVRGGCFFFLSERFSCLSGRLPRARARDLSRELLVQAQQQVLEVLEGAGEACPLAVSALPI